MMKNSSLLKWTNSKNNKNKNANKNWIHPPEALQGGHIAYLVKFLGSTEVSQCKGIEVVKEAVTKLRFNQQIKKIEGSKISKVELTISVDGVAIQHPKTKKISFQYPLHQISYCADDKAEKRFFSFIAKEADREAHTCFVFISDKLAEEITLTIGQAFDLAYKKFLENSNREGDIRKQLMTVKQQLQKVQMENEALKERLTEMASIKDSMELQRYIQNNRILDFTTNGTESSPPGTDHDSQSNGESPSPLPLSQLPPLPPRNIIKADVIVDGEASDDDFDFDPRADETMPQSVSPSSNSNNTHDVIGSPASDGFPTDDDEDGDFDPRAEENSPFGKGFEIKQNSHSPDALNLNGISNFPTLVPPPPRPVRQQDKLIPNHLLTDSSDPFSAPPPRGADVTKQFSEMEIGFNRGISFGTTGGDFTLDSLDPLKN